MRKLFKENGWVRFLVRWLVCGLGLWAAAALLGHRLSFNHDTDAIVVAALILAIINTILKPIIIILTLPAVLLSLGLFMIVINGFMVYLAGKLYTSLHVKNFGAAVLAGMIIGLVNYLVTAILEGRET